jgi:iron complex transport system permease protein
MDGFGVLFVILSYFIPNHFLTYSNEAVSFILFIVVMITFISIKKLFNSNQNKMIQNIWQQSSIKNIIIVGLAFNLLIGALFSIVQFLFMALNIKFPTSIWFGNFRQYDDSWLSLFLICFILTYAIVIKLSNNIELLNIGVNFSQGLKVDINRLQKQCLYLSLVLTVLVISYFGVFSFLGLIFPHILRSLNIFKKNMKAELIFGSLIMGVIFSGIDFLCYSFIYRGAEFPVGMVSSVLGAFFLIFLIMKSKISVG